MSVKELRGITPLFQTELNKQLGKVLECWNNGLLYEMHIALQGLIGLLNPEDSGPLLENDVVHIEKEMGNAMKQRGVDLYWTREMQRVGVVRVLRTNLFNLFLKVMALLHQKGYLELYRRQVETNVPPEFFGQVTR